MVGQQTRQDRTRYEEQEVKDLSSIPTKNHLPQAPPCHHHVPVISISIKQLASLPQLHSNYPQAFAIEMAGFMELDSGKLRMLEKTL